MPDASADLSWRDAVGLLHEELDRLPDRYRLPLLLCGLDGKTRDEAARILTSSAGSIKGRPLVHRHGSMVLHVCRRVLGHHQDAEDTFQATFLVLARNAAALHNKTAPASFLYGTAYRIAMKAKQSAARRRKHEGQTPPRSLSDPAGELLWREVRALLDEEIARLPVAYRSVFVHARRGIWCRLDRNAHGAAAAGWAIPRAQPHHQWPAAPPWKPKRRRACVGRRRRK